ncbi:hypothetical protein GCM10009841_06570 [Microlunatus panaciterrae]|uniref:Major facilitator superfamily (MFS) profile domain-containing protein n=1 Tax=Microlunatus panaciterrae TaxID=400768 RepID=A0ABS2RI63_9ACTN|nr:hypothetical protein [Microlunatus panaciterrae]MBM7798689.1 hypothetical protein [Microlunatus panaciterrae]
MNLKTIQTIIGGIFGIAAGVAGVVIGIMKSEAAYIVIGVAFLAATGYALLAGLSASPRGSLPPNPKVGAKFMGLSDRQLLIVGAILLVGFVVGGILLAL